VDRKMRTKAAKSCLLADRSKIGQTALVQTGTLCDFDVFITESTAPASFLKQARRMAGKVILV
jgi:DeoR/GlpR family transcriptional regulator of sugar metabolism